MDTDLTDAKTTLTVLFAISLAIANVTAAKVAFIDLPLLGGTVVPAGFVAIGASFLWTDLINEHYGREYARSVVNGTVIGLVVAWGLIYVAIALPTAPFYPLGEEFELVLGESTSVVFASILTILVSQNLDVAVFDRLKQWTGGRHKWARNIGSTATSQLLDTALFITLAFAILPRITGGEITAWDVIPELVVAQFALKLLVAIADTPVFYAVSALLSRTDTQTPTPTTHN